MILRVWRARLDPARLEDFRRFERERCLPMLHRPPRFLTVLFSRQAADLAASLTIWEDWGAVVALTSSPSYRRTARELAESGLLRGEHSEEVFEVESGDLRPEALLGALGLWDLFRRIARMKRSVAQELPEDMVATTEGAAAG